MEQAADDTIEIRVPCKPEYVRTVRRTIADFAESIDMPRSAVEEVEVAASEAVANVVRHAYANLDCKIPPMRVKLSHKRGRLTVEIIDKGCGFAAPPGDEIPDVDLNRDGGLGIILIKCLMDKVSYTSGPSGGTRIRMTKSARQAIRVATKMRVAHLRGTPV
jgi:anti-sigma regulatory factor (Ser/Thr protein kinase)